MNFLDSYRLEIIWYLWKNVMYIKTTKIDVDFFMLYSNLSEWLFIMSNGRYIQV